VSRDQYARAREGALSSADFERAIIRDSLIGVVVVLILALVHFA
jgi:hypothetical protein